MKEMNIYLFTISGETYWICATTAFEALLHFCEEQVFNIEDFEKADDIKQLPREEWSKRWISYTDVPDDVEPFEVSFEEYMKGKDIDDHKTHNGQVEVFASSTYE